MSNRRLFEFAVGKGREGKGRKRGKHGLRVSFVDDETREMDAPALDDLPSFGFASD
jgi:hypothetical protein